MVEGSALPVRNPAGDIVPGIHHPLLEFMLLPIFIGLQLSDLALLLRDAWVQHYSDGHAVFHSAEPADRLYVILDGHVELFVETEAKKSVLDVVRRPALLGEAALYGDGCYGESARIVGHSRLLAIPAQPFLAVLSQRFDLTRRMLAVMSNRLHGLVKHISSLKIDTTAQRLAGFLLGIADSHDGIVTARFLYDKRLAAEALGMTAESLSRALGRLEQLGVQRRSESEVIIDDLAALRAFCGAEDGA